MSCKVKSSEKRRFPRPEKVAKPMMKIKQNCNIHLEMIEMHIYRDGCYTGAGDLEHLCYYTIALTNQIEWEIRQINRDKTSKVFICSCYMIGCKSTPLPSCLKQLIPIANTHDGALPGFHQPPRVTPLLEGEEGCVCVCAGDTVLVSQDCDRWSVTPMKTSSNLLCPW